MKKIRTLLATLLAVIMCTCVAAPAFAAEAGPVPAQPTIVAESGDEGIMPLGTDRLMIGADWRTIATNSSGINGRLYAAVTGTVPFDGASYKLEVVMFNSGGYIVWQGNDCAGFPGTKFDLWCGSDVVRVDMRITPRYFWILNNTFEVEVTY